MTPTEKVAAANQEIQQRDYSDWLVHVSWTQLEQLLMCGVKYDLAYIQKIFRPPFISLPRGRAPHSSSEADLTSKLETGELLSLSDIQGIAAAALEEAWNENGVMLTSTEKTIGEKNLKGQTEDLVVRLASIHHEEVAPFIDPAFIERKWEIETPNKKIHISGRMDVQETPQRQHRIRELKTRKTSPPQNIEHQMNQLSMYSLASKVLDGRVAPITVDFVVGTKTKTYQQSRETTRDHNDWVPLLKRIERACAAVSAGIFIPAPDSAWWCKPDQCGYWDICDSVNNQRSYFV